MNRFSRISSSKRTKMASSTLQNLLRNQTRPASKILTRFRNPIPPFPPTQIPKSINPISNHPESDYSRTNRSCSTHFYPGFPFGFFLDPVSPSALIRPEPDGEAAPDDSDVVRADSVKKKRKRKMNKHKLKKLRKRLRRKT